MLVADFRHGFLVNVATHHLFGNTFVVWCAFGEPPAAELGVPPFAVGDLGVVTIALAEDHVVRIAEFPAIAHVVFSLETWEDGLRRAVDIGGGTDDFRLLHAVIHHVQPDASLVERLEDGFDGLRIFGGEGLGEGTNFFRMIFPNFLAVDGGEADFVNDCFGIPWFTHAEAVHFSGLHVCHHLRRRDGDERDIRASAGGIAGIDATGGEPVAQPHGVGAGREGHGEGHRVASRLFGINEWFEGLGIGGHFALQIVRKADALSISIDNPRRNHRHLGSSAQTHAGGDGHADEHVGGLNIAIGEGIADGRPAGTFGDGGIDAVFFEKSFFVSDYKRRAVGEGDDAEVDIRRFRGIAGGLRADPARGQAAGEESECSGLGGDGEEFPAG